MIPKMIQAKTKSKWNDKIYCRHCMKSFTIISQEIWIQCMRTDTGTTNGHCHFSFHNKHKKYDKPT